MTCITISDVMEEYIQPIRSWSTEIHLEYSGLGHISTVSPVSAVTSLIVSAASLVSYFIYQNLNPWIQQRSLDYSKYEILRTGFLKHLEQLGKLVDEDGKLNIPVIRIYLLKQTDNDRSLTRRELENLVLHVMKTGKLNVNKQLAVSEVMKSFDFNNDEEINVHEFVKGCQKWIEETQTLFRQFDNDNNNEISKTELEQLIRTVKLKGFQRNYKDVIKELFKDFDKDGIYKIDEPEFVDGVEKWVDKAIHVADCSDKTSSIDEFDRIYGAVVMNNVSGLTTLLVVVYAKDLPWDYSAEVLTVFVVCAAVGILVYSRTSYGFSGLAY
ncbi:Calcium-binding EF-hand family protein [Abeliophyllum distichum]|uniref:Calcium-binding EF-hand family protein n=1 Tax=Abeliophyllum distichum TaxID=126358 RepID=A0ABD1QGC7_9LAMI